MAVLDYLTENLCPTENESGKQKGPLRARNPITRILKVVFLMTPQPVFQ
jgi:hypothetical protein